MQYRHEGDLRSSTTPNVAIENLPVNLKDKWRFYVDDRYEIRPEFFLFEGCLPQIAFVHEAFLILHTEKQESEKRVDGNKRKCNR